MYCSILVIPDLGRQRQADPWVLLASEPNLINTRKYQSETLFQTARGMAPGEQHLRLIYIPNICMCLHAHTPGHPNVAVVSQGFLKTWQQHQWCWPPGEGPTVALDPFFSPGKGNGMYVFCTYIYNYILHYFNLAYLSRRWKISCQHFLLITQYSPATATPELSLMYHLLKVETHTDIDSILRKLKRRF